MKGMKKRLKLVQEPDGASRAAIAASFKPIATVFVKDE